MRTDCLIHFTADGKLDIFKNGQRAYASVPVAWLELYLAEHGVSHEDYKKVVDQLNEEGKASFQLRALKDGTSFLVAGCTLEGLVVLTLARCRVRLSLGVSDGWRWQ